MTERTIPIPEAAIDAGEEALHQADERGAPEAYHEWAHRVVVAILRAAAPHLLKELQEEVERLRRKAELYDKEHRDDRYDGLG